MVGVKPLYSTRHVGGFISVLDGRECTVYLGIVAATSWPSHCQPM